MDTLQTQLNQAIKAIKSRDYAHAREILKLVINSDPNVVDAWLLYAHVAPNKEQARQCLERVLRLDPHNPRGLKMMQQLQSASPSPPLQTPAQSKHGQALQRPLVPDNVQNSGEGTPSQPGSHAQKQLRDQVEPPRIEQKSKRDAKEFNILWGVVVILIVCLLVSGGIAAYRYSPSISGLFSNAPTPTPDELFSVIYTNLRTANAEDIDGYMATIHSRSPLYQQTDQALRSAFSTYDLSYVVSDLRIDKQTSNESKVHFTLTTKKVRGPTFRDNIVEGVFVLRPENGEWKIYQQDIIDVSYLN